MTRAEAIRRVLLIGPYEDQWGGIEEKNNSWDFVFGIKDGVPDPEGDEWFGTIETTYGSAVGWYFWPIAEALDNEWSRVDTDPLTEASSEYTKAWILLGYDVKAVLAEDAA